MYQYRHTWVKIKESHKTDTEEIGLSGSCIKQIKVSNYHEDTSRCYVKKNVYTVNF